MSEESQHSRSHGAWPWLSCGGTILTIYFLLFGLMYLDIEVFGTSYFLLYVIVNDEIFELLFWIYWPLLKLFGFI